MLIDPSDDAGIEILNGDFSAGAANWNLGNGWAIAGGKAVFTDVVAPGELATDALSMVPQNTYTIQFDISGIVPAPPGTTSVILRLGNATSASFDTNGTKSVTLTWPEGPDTVRFEVATVNPGDTLSIDNVSITALGDYVSAVLEIKTLSPKGINFQPAINADIMRLVTCWKDKTSVRILQNIP